MRVLHVVPGIADAFGGPLNVPHLLRGLEAQGVDVTLLTTNDDPNGRLDIPLREPVLKDGVRYVFHNVWPMAGRYGLAPSLLRTLHERLPAVDLVHIHWIYNFACIAAARASLRAGVPFVVQPRGSLDPYVQRKNSALKRAYLATVGRPLLTHADAVVFTAEQERDRAMYSPRRPEWIVPNGIDWALYEDLPQRGTFREAFPRVSGPFLLFLGRLARQKGIDRLLHAFARVLQARPDLQLVLAGPDHEGYEAEMRALVRTLGLDARVIFAGFLGGELKRAAFVDADLFVLPSNFENFGTVIIEALACGLPVVISDQVHIHRELASAGAATVVTSSVESVASGIASALDDVDGRQRIATLGPALVRSRYSWETIVPDLIMKYRDLVAARSASRT